MDDREKAAAELGTTADSVDHYSFPQTFGSTAGPFSEAGGQAITTMQIDAYTDGVRTVFFCAGRRIKWVGGWTPDIRMPTL